VAYSPLGGHGYDKKVDVLQDPTVLRVAAAHNKSSAQVHPGRRVCPALLSSFSAFTSLPDANPAADGSAPGLVRSVRWEGPKAAQHVRHCALSCGQVALRWVVQQGHGSVTATGFTPKRSKHP
jgi:Aldo/keto reductases, related to diketogulonate reductase